MAKGGVIRLKGGITCTIIEKDDEIPFELGDAVYRISLKIPGKNETLKVWVYSSAVKKASK